MLYGKNHGLYGKARIAHLRSRVARAYAAQRIAEDLEPDLPDGRPRRFIRIGHRAEFLPSAAGSGEGPAPASQMKLPLAELGTASAGDARRSQKLEERGPTSTLVDSGIALQSEVRARLGSPESQTTNRTAASALPALNLLQPKKRSRFSIAGFAVGCALGGAAAGIFLLLLYIVVR